MRRACLLLLAASLSANCMSLGLAPGLDNSGVVPLLGKEGSGVVISSATTPYPSSTRRGVFFIVATGGGGASVESPSPLPRGEGVARPAFSSAGAGRVRGHFGQASYKVTRPAPLPSPHATSGRHPNLEKPGTKPSVGPAGGAFIRNQTVHGAPTARMSGIAGHAAPLPSNIRHRSPNPAVVAGTPNSHIGSTGGISGTGMRRKF
jgi:hypothetical protein